MFLSRINWRNLLVSPAAYRAGVVFGQESTGQSGRAADHASLATSAVSKTAASITHTHRERERERERRPQVWS